MAGAYDDSQIDPYSGPLPIPPAPKTGGMLGGASVAAPASGDGLDALIQSQIGKLQATENMGTWDRLTGGTRQRREAMETIPALAGLRSVMAKPEELQKQYMSLLKESATAFATLDPDTQSRMLPIFGPMIAKLNTLAGVNIDPEHLKTAFTQPGAVEAMANVFLDSGAFQDDEKKAIMEGAKGLKGPALKTYYDDVQGKKIAQMEPRLRQEMPALVASVRRTLTKPDAPLNVSEFQAALAKMDPSAKDPLVGQVIAKVMADDGFVENLGLISSGRSKKAGEVAEEVKGAEAKAQVAPERLGKDFNRFAQDMFPGKRVNQLTGAESKAVNDRIDAEAAKVSALQGSEVANVKLAQPLSPKERADLTDVNGLVKNLDLVQPPAGTTHRDVASGAKGGQYVDITEKQKGKVEGLKKSKAIIDQIFGLADQVITAKTPAEAFVQRGQKPAEALFKTNPQAAAYRDAREAFVGNLSREIGSEKGVLTDRDVTRMGDALPNFSDTATVKEIKKALINDIWTAGRESTVNEISGKPTDRKKVDDLLNRLEQVNNKRDTDIRIKNTKSGKVLMLGSGFPIPAGWEELKK